MIKTEFLNDGTLIKHFSDAGFMLQQVGTGMKYADPVDVVPSALYDEWITAANWTAYASYIVAV